MKKFCAALLTFVLTTSLLSAFTVMTPPTATAPEKTAAKELEKYLRLIAGGDYEKVSGVAHVGKSPEALAAFGLSQWSDLDPDEVFYCVDDKGELWIAGEGTRGTIYAVYEFLEREYGVRFFTADDELVPAAASFALPPAGTFWRYLPPFMSRVAAYNHLLFGSNDFKAKTRTNFFTAIPEEWGGNDSIIGFCHTMDQLIGTDYYDAHPEWFAFRDGQRRCGPDNQLCLTNAEMRRELTRKVIERLRADGGKSHIISVSQNDNQRPCTCPTCAAFVKANGNETDMLIHFVNQVAEEVEKEFPDVYVETLAYNYTRKPPRTVRPRHNVAIRYCTIEAHSFYPLESAANNDLFEEIAPWRAIAPKMLFWNYLTTFTKYYLPHPNWHNIAQDIRLFRDCHAINIFQQGSHNTAGRIADLGDLRVYLTARLLWNPDLDEKELIREFCDHYYGPAADVIENYLRDVTAQVMAHPAAMDTCYPQNTDSWLPKEELVRVWKYLFDAVDMLREDPVYGPRMAVAATPMTMNLLEHSSLLTTPADKRVADLRDVDPVELIAFCEEIFKATGTTQIAENAAHTTAAWLDKMHSIYENRPVIPKIPTVGERPAGLPENVTFLDWNIEDIANLVVRDPKSCMPMADAAAIGGTAVRMPNTHSQWYVQLSNLPRGIFDIYLTVRCDAKPGTVASGNALTSGVYPGAPEVVFCQVAQCVGSNYYLFKLGKCDTREVQYLYCAPVVNNTLDYVWFDRIIFTPSQK